MSPQRLTRTQRPSSYGSPQSRRQPTPRRNRRPAIRVIPWIGLTGGIGAGKSTALDGAGAAGSGVPVDGPGRPRALRVAGGPRRRRAALRARRASRRAAWTARPSPGRRSPPTRTAAGSSSCCGRAWGRGWRPFARRPTRPTLRRAPPWSRSRCCSSRAPTTASTPPSRSSPMRRSASERAAARGHEALSERAARQLSQQEKSQRATYTVVNDGTERDLQRQLSAILDMLPA